MASPDISQAATPVGAFDVILASVKFQVSDPAITGQIFYQTVGEVVNGMATTVQMTVKSVGFIADGGQLATVDILRQPIFSAAWIARYDRSCSGHRCYSL